jgi:hypothetical protein
MAILVCLLKTFAVWANAGVIYAKKAFSGQSYTTFMDKIYRRHDTQHNDTQHNNKKRDTQHNGTWHSILLCLVSVKLSVVYAEWHKQTHYAECNNNECRYA